MCLRGPEKIEGHRSINPPGIVYQVKGLFTLDRGSDVTNSPVPRMTQRSLPMSALLLLTIAHQGNLLWPFWIGSKLLFIGHSWAVLISDEVGAFYEPRHVSGTVPQQVAIFVDVVWGTSFWWGELIWRLSDVAAPTVMEEKILEAEAGPFVGGAQTEDWLGTKLKTTCALLLLLSVHPSPVWLGHAGHLERVYGEGSGTEPQPETSKNTTVNFPGKFLVVFECPTRKLEEKRM